MEKKQIIKAIMTGKVIATIKHTSSSWMQREIKFAYFDKWMLWNITGDIATLYWSKVWKHWWVIVKGCWMDMIFHVLYTVIWYDNYKKRNQKYNSL